MSDMPVHERISHRIMLYIASNGLRINQFSLEDIIKEELAPLETQLQEADTTATAMGLALTEVRMENERLRDLVRFADEIIHITSYQYQACHSDTGYKEDQEKLDSWHSRRDELLKKEGA